MIFKNIFAAEDELQHSMNGVVCMSKFLNRKVTFWGRASGIERRKASLFESLLCDLSPTLAKWAILTTKGSNQALGANMYVSDLE